MEEIWAVGDEAVNAGADHGAHPPNTGPMAAVAVKRPASFPIVTK
jgi:hypothetical protein